MTWRRTRHLHAHDLTAKAPVGAFALPQASNTPIRDRLISRGIPVAFTPRPDVQTIPWVALNAQDPDIRLIACRKAWGTRRLQITGCDKLTQEQKEGLKALGFYWPRKARAEVYVRENLRISIGEIRRVFPNANQVIMPQEEAAHVAPLRSAALDDGGAAVEAKLAELTVTPLGHNVDGLAVFEGDEGRYIALAGGAFEHEGREPGGGRFLRGETPEDLALCADAFVREIVGGRNMRVSDLRKFASIVMDRPADEIEKTPRMREVQEAIEAAQVRRLHRTAIQNGEEGRQSTLAVAERLLEGQPQMSARTSTSVMLQQYSTPMPLAVAVQRVVGDTSGRSVLEPTIGNGALVSTLDAGRIVGVDLDPARLANIERGRPDVAAFQGDATLVDFTRFNDGLPFDQVVCNPPFGRLDKPVSFKGLKVTRLDHQVLLRALDARKDDGIGVFIIGADSYVDTKAGKVSGSSRYLFNWLADHYEADVVEVPGSVFAKQGATFPIRLVAVGKRGADSPQVPDELPLLESHDAIYDWCERMRDRFASHLAPVAAGDTPLQVPVEPDETAKNESEPRENVSDAQENSYQSPYPARSQIGEASAMIPRNLLTPTRQALDEVAAANGGDLDQFVADSLGWSVQEMVEQEYLSPEQIDAVALAIDAHQRSGGARALLEGDQTGLGKGRVMAAMARYHALQGTPVVFLTETPTLFTDFWRDLRDIGSEGLFKPMIVNAGVSIIDPINGMKLVPSTPASIVKTAVASEGIPEGYNLVLATYSQFNRDRSNEHAGKSRWITTATQGCALLLDESHNAAGNSNTNQNISLAIDAAASTCYSSATAIKEGKNVSAYYRLFPRTVDIGSLPETLAAGGEVLQEVLSGMLARDGVFIRREHDLSNLSFKTVADTPERQRRNRELSDHLAGILEAMNYMAGDINKAVTEYNKEVKKLIEKMPESERTGNRMGAISVNFGSRLYQVYRQFLLALEVDLAADRAIEALRSGKKPVLVLENTGESLLNDVIAAAKQAELSGEEELTAEDVVALTTGGDIPLGEGISFRNVLLRMLDRLGYMQTTDRYGNRGKEAISSEEFDKAHERLREMIMEFPDLPMSPIDSIRERIEAAGFSFDELSGRKMSVERREDSFFATPQESRAKAETVRRFNTGQTDAIMLTRAGSTGISLHASEKFPDQRQRVLIEVQSAADVNKRVQFFGRVNRKGQTSDPEIETLSTGLIGQARPIAMQNAKLRKLSANTTSNQDNAALDGTVPDFINEIGDQVASRYLEARPDLARRLDIDMEQDEDREATYFINKLTSRLVMLRVAEQEDIYAALTTEYNRLITELDEKGLNPLRSKELDLRCTEVKREIFESGDPTSDSAFNQPVYAKTIEYEIERFPMRSDAVSARIESNRKALGEEVGLSSRQSLDKVVEALEKARPDALERALTEKFKSVGEALQAKDPNGVQRVKQRFDFMCKALRELDLGQQVRFTNNDGEAVFGIVSDLRLPDNLNQLAQLSAYVVGIAVPGEERPIERSFYGLREDANYSVPSKWLQDQDFLRRFDEAPSGTLKLQRIVLDGNLFKAAQLAAQHRMGSSVVYTDAEGQRHRGVMLSKHVSAKELNALPVRIETPAMVKALLAEDRGLILSNAGGVDISAEDDVVLIQDGPNMALQCPGVRSRGGHVFGNRELIGIVGDFAGSRSVMTARFPRERLEDALKVLYRDGLSFYAPSRHRDTINRLSNSVYNNESDTLRCNGDEEGGVSRKQVAGMA